MVISHLVLATLAQILHLHKQINRIISYIKIKRVSGRYKEGEKEGTKRAEPLVNVKFCSAHNMKGQVKTGQDR